MSHHSLKKKKKTEQRQRYRVKQLNRPRGDEESEEAERRCDGLKKGEKVPDGAEKKRKWRLEEWWKLVSGMMKENEGKSEMK